jgi:UDP-GlcNAc:undecaprenyl-phosphate GlcNAc-1-phosphate transferase
MKSLLRCGFAIVLGFAAVVGASAHPVPLGAGGYFLAPKADDKPPPQALARTAAMLEPAAPTNQSPEHSQRESSGMEVSVLIYAGIASLAGCLLLLYTRRLHAHWTTDFEASGVQKHHKGSPPRVAGLALGLGLLVGLVLLWKAGTPAASVTAVMLFKLWACSMPVALLGLLEDTTKRVAPRWRMVGAALSALAGMWLLGAVVPGVGIGALDPLFQWAPLAVLLTVLLVSGFTHALNIVDGLNGLAGGLTLLMLAASAYAANLAQDTPIFELCLLLAAVLLGFLLVNFPRGAIFLGDGGAYFLGFSLVQIWILLVVRNPDVVSPWFIVAVGFHPTMETIFSIVRRKLHPRKRKATAPDRLHLHTLAYRRTSALLMAHLPWAEAWVANALAGVAVVLFAALPVALALLAPAHTGWQMSVVAVGVLAYLLWFRFLVRWGGWRKAKQRPVAAVEAGHAAPAG